MSGGKAGQIALALLGSAAGEQGAERNPLHDEEVGGVVADAAKLFNRDAGRQHAPGAAILLWKRHREQPEFAQQRVHVLGILCGAVDVIGAVGDFLPRHAPYQVLNLTMIIS